MADPQLEAVLVGLAQASAGAQGPATVEGFRVALRELTRMLDFRDIPVGRVENRMIPGPDGEIGIRIYTPIAAGARMLETLIYFHGGGFVAGDLETHDTLCRGLTARSGCRVISVDYRLAPEHPFPAAIDDSYAALRWIEANATTLGVDSNRIAVGGDSAGGNIAAVVAQLARGAGNPVVRFQLLIYPVVQWDVATPSRQQFAEDPIIPRDVIDMCARNYFGPMVPATDFRAAPLAASDLAGLPPAYVITAGLDPLRDEGTQYAEKLREAGVAVEHVGYDDMIHGFMSMSNALDTAKLAIERAGDALRNALR